MIIVLIGPIDYWWNENWQTDQHKEYMEWRNDLSKMLVEAGHLVYRPHEAFKGAWDERAQDVNSVAIQLCDLVINLNPGVPAYGTAEEMKLAEAHNKPIRFAPPRDYTQIADLIKQLDDPYGDVNRKSYTNG